jgi:hypothetical protein
MEGRERLLSGVGVDYPWCHSAMMCRLVGNSSCHMVMGGLGPGCLGLVPLGVQLLRLKVDYVDDQSWFSVTLFHHEVLAWSVLWAGWTTLGESGMCGIRESVPYRVEGG